METLEQLQINEGKQRLLTQIVHDSELANIPLEFALREFLDWDEDVIRSFVKLRKKLLKKAPKPVENIPYVVTPYTTTFDHYAQPTFDHQYVPTTTYCGGGCCGNTAEGGSE